MSPSRHVITQGEHCAVADPHAQISTLLGSCVACCLWDDVAGVGGMNHMLLTSKVRSDGICDLAGVNAMELLINELQKLGAVRSRLKAKAFGGAKMVSGLSDIGQNNADFVLRFLDQEGIICVSSSLGGTTARQIVFTPSTGAVKLKKQNVEVKEVVPPAAESTGNDLELF